MKITKIVTYLRKNVCEHNLWKLAVLCLELHPVRSDIKYHPEKIAVEKIAANHITIARYIFFVQ